MSMLSKLSLKGYSYLLHRETSEMMRSIRIERGVNPDHPLIKAHDWFTEKLGSEYVESQHFAAVVDAIYQVAKEDRTA